ncbi:hypothetical protein TSTA_082770 [Talaromyces stipitatus ATCC 10500]|uniref:Uncharacterized protein n=1 Tax=Talaromyces stipitatus (strain ATCC 10500 / CBS 375.48 / QM 6759 / NRRL 1006) TaxID=441959 RepID=B8M1A2_TALSN|nr:uncharacterized protein TSTA_082770 [Talaromyces stipitatus ATCC 10500]EED21044.1 hypothetical protein TSTA_082770 [Talaromyces stipitatus ATCC 10500]
MRVIDAARKQGHTVEMHLIERYADRVECSVDSVNKLGGILKLMKRGAVVIKRGSRDSKGLIYPVPQYFLRAYFSTS